VLPLVPSERNHALGKAMPRERWKGTDIFFINVYAVVQEDTFAISSPVTRFVVLDEALADLSVPLWTSYQ
jgi:hypothetical protein